MSYKEDQAAWDEKHNNRARAFLEEFKQLCHKHQVQPNYKPDFSLIYTDPFVPDVLYQICPEVVGEYF